MTVPSTFLKEKPSFPVEFGLRGPYSAVGDVLPPDLQNMTLIMCLEYIPTITDIEYALLDCPPLREDRKTAKQLKTFFLDFRGLNYDSPLLDLSRVQSDYMRTGYSFTYELNLQLYNGFEAGGFPRV